MIRLDMETVRPLIKEIIKEEIDKEEAKEFIEKNKDFEKRVKEISANVVSELFRILWQKKVFYDEIKK